MALPHFSKLSQKRQNFRKTNHYHLANKKLGHLLTRSGLTHPEVSLMIFPGSFCILVCSILLSSVIYYEACCLYVAAGFFCIPLFFLKMEKGTEYKMYVMIFCTTSVRNSCNYERIQRDIINEWMS